MNPHPSERRVDAIARHLNTMSSNNTKANAPDITRPEDMITPLIPVPVHEPFPIAMVSRPPYGAPNLSSLKVPQNIAFISALRNCRKSILIQTPNLNAQDLIPELLSAARRGIKLDLVTCLGYNDAGELLPLQGGHNEGVAHKLYKELEPEFHANLDMYHYIGKDQVAPIHNSHKARSCHIKLMVIDEEIAICGSGNQDSQSWYHSQYVLPTLAFCHLLRLGRSTNEVNREINVMMESSLVVRKLEEGIRRNQNTWKYGLVRKGDASKDKLVGCWVDKDGKMADGSIGADAGKMAWFKGVKGAVDRVRGVGGF
jgi:phosphatidylserine/phosphatidylglycerophosphate/cardiolipin synthase-like enzyme